MTIEEHVPLAPLTTFGLGGAARFLLRVGDVVQLQEAITFAQEKKLNTLLLGGGSNLLVGDGGFDGLVIKIEMRGVVQDGDTLVAGAGESWDALVARSVADGLWGLENLSGIPGTVGAAPIQNIGAYGAEVADTLAWLDAFDTHEDKTVRFLAQECGFAYRTSRFKQESGRYVVLQVAFALKKNGVPNLSYKDLAGLKQPTLAGIRAQVLSVRAQKFPDLAKEGTAGSFFLNPIVSGEVAGRLAAQYPELPQFPAEGGVKLSLAWLLDEVLHLKGARVGGARTFERQPLVLVATPDARAGDVCALAEQIKKEAKEKLGIEIQEEVRIVR